MSDRSRIEWTDATWPIVNGCRHVSAGCDNCWAERLVSTHLRHLPQYRGLTRKGRWTGEVRFNEAALDAPLHWRKPRWIFVAPHGDLFSDAVEPRDVDTALEVMAACPQHTFIVLTKRPQNIHAKIYEVSEARPLPELGGGDHLPNVLLGVSVEDQPAADERILALLASGWLGKTWVSVEPMLGPIILRDEWLARLSWVVVGGESGPGARPMHPDWARSLRDQCVAAGVPFFFWKFISADGYALSVPLETARAALDGKEAKQ